MPTRHDPDRFASAKKSAGNVRCEKSVQECLIRVLDRAHGADYPGVVYEYGRCTERINRSPEQAAYIGLMGDVSPHCHCASSTYSDSVNYPSCRGGIAFEIHDHRVSGGSRGTGDCSADRAARAGDNHDSEL